MKQFINAGFGIPIGRDRIEELKLLGIEGIRQDVNHNRDILLETIKELGEADIDTIFLLAGGDMTHEEHVWTNHDIVSAAAYTATIINQLDLFKNSKVYFEVGNEPDVAHYYWKDIPLRLNTTFLRTYLKVKEILGNRGERVELITGGISNLTPSALDWLECFMSYPIPPESIIGFHRYPPLGWQSGAHKGFPKREAELERLKGIARGKDIARGHRLFCTETGLSQGPFRVPRAFPLCWFKEDFRLSQVQQAKWFKADKAFYSGEGLVGYNWYQIYDGPGDTILDHYGIYKSNREKQKVICSVIGG